MQFKEGIGWKACYDEEKNIYTAQRSWRGFYQLCEIDSRVYDKLGDDDAPDKLISSGRVLFESDDDYYCPPHYTVYDEKYNELAPWSSAEWIAGKTGVLFSATVIPFGAVRVFPSHKMRLTVPSAVIRSSKVKSSTATYQSGMVSLVFPCQTVDAFVTKRKSVTMFWPF